MIPQWVDLSDAKLSRDEVAIAGRMLSRATQEVLDYPRPLTTAELQDRWNLILNKARQSIATQGYLLDRAIVFAELNALCLFLPPKKDLRTRMMPALLRELKARACVRVQTATIAIGEADLASRKVELEGEIELELPIVEGVRECVLAILETRAGSLGRGFFVDRDHAGNITAGEAFDLPLGTFTGWLKQFD